jgi:hypothetical protein
MAEIVMSNLLAPDEPERSRIEQAVRAAFETVDGRWSVKLARSVSLDRIAIDLTLPEGAMAFTSVHEGDADAAITERVRSAFLWNSR